MVEDDLLAGKEMTAFPLIIGHRGDSSHAPENTLAAIRLAMDVGADGVEFDVRLAKDGVPVVIHDTDLKRVAGRDLRVHQLTSNELGQLDVGSWFNAAFPDRAQQAFTRQTVPRFERVLELVSESAKSIYVELKTEASTRDQLIVECSKLLRHSSVLPKIIVKSFDLEAINAVRNELPTARTAALFEPSAKTLLSRRANLVDTATSYRATDISLHWSLVNRGVMEAAECAGMRLTVWTVEHPRWVNKALDMGIAALITNDPAKLLAALNRSLKI